MVTKQDFLNRMNQLKKDIDNGKIVGKKNIFRARKNIAALKHRAKKKSEPKFKVRTIKSKSIDKDQGFLPGFLKQLDMVRIEELVAQKVFEQIKSSLLKTDEQIEITFASDRKSKKKAV